MQTLPGKSVAPSDVSGERETAYDVLAAADETLGLLIARHGRPDPFVWPLLADAVGDDPFAELVLHIISQQISTHAALIIYSRVREAASGSVAAEGLINISEQTLRAAGVSGAKARSIHDLAERVLDGRLSFARVGGSDDERSEAELDAVLGVGPWSAQMFLLHHFRRPDVFPAADIGLQRGAQAAFELQTRPTATELEDRAQRWRPYRSYAAALLWAAGRQATSEHSRDRGESYGQLQRCCRDSRRSGRHRPSGRRTRKAPGAGYAPGDWSG
jgi:DNA-3-methyladenine glycosylase II